MIITLTLLLKSMVTKLPTVAAADGALALVVPVLARVQDLVPATLIMVAVAGAVDTVAVATTVVVIMAAVMAVAVGDLVILQAQIIHLLLLHHHNLALSM
jgi:hypothetical protein